VIVIVDETTLRCNAHQYLMLFVFLILTFSAMNVGFLILDMTLFFMDNLGLCAGGRRPHLHLFRLDKAHDEDDEG